MPRPKGIFLFAKIVNPVHMNEAGDSRVARDRGPSGGFGAHFGEHAARAGDIAMAANDFVGSVVAAEDVEEVLVLP